VGGAAREICSRPHSEEIEAHRAGVAGYVAMARAHRAALAEAAQPSGIAAARSA
jgi:hypothetical protein